MSQKRPFNRKFGTSWFRFQVPLAPKDITLVCAFVRAYQSHLNICLFVFNISVFVRVSLRMSWRR